MMSANRAVGKTYFLACLGMAGLWIALLAIFNRNPSIDLWTSSHFFTPTECRPDALKAACGYFHFGRMDWVLVLRAVLYDLPFLAAGLIVVALVAAYRSKAWRARLPLQRLWLSLAALALGPGLLTNLILKAHSGRPRPISVDLFGGSLHFVPAGSFAGACHSNCSFVSGEAAGAAWMLCLLVLLPPGLRWRVALPLFLISILTAYLRVAMGGHFVSDVVLGWLLSIIVFTGLLALEARLGARADPKPHPIDNKDIAPVGDAGNLAPRGDSALI